MYRKIVLYVRFLFSSAPTYQIEYVLNYKLSAMKQNNEFYVIFNSLKRSRTRKKLSYWNAKV